MDATALFKIQYGLFAIGAESGGRSNACIANTLAQATAEPPRLLLTMQKANLTTELIRAKHSLAASVLGEDVPLELVAGLGTRSGRDFDKLADVEWRPDAAGNPLILGRGVVAHYSLEVEEERDLDTHVLFVLRPTMLEKFDGESITYADYRRRKAGTGKQWVCTLCHYVYDGAIPFEELPDDWVCPVCGEPKSAFQPA